MAGSSSAARNFATTLAAQLVSWAMAFLVLRYVPGYLRGEGMALISIAGAFSVALTQFVSVGTNAILVKEIAQQPARTWELTIATATLRLLFSALALLVGVGIAFALRYDARQIWLIFLVLCLMPITQFNEALAAILKGLNEFPRYNLATLTERFAAAAIQILLVHFRAPIWAFALVTGVSGLLGFLVATTGLWRHRAVFAHPVRLQLPRRETMLFLIRSGFPLMVGVVFISLWEPGNKILLSKLAGPLEVSWFELTKRIAGTTMFIPAALTGVMLPVLSRLHSSDPAQFALLTRRLFRIILICAVPFASVLLFAPSRILDLLHYPRELYGSVPVLQALGAGIILWYLSQVAAISLVAMNQEKRIGQIGMRLAIFCLPTCAVCIGIAHRLPWVHNGALGAMTADIVIEAWMLRSYLKYLPAGVFGWSEIWLLLRTLIAALPLSGLLYLMPSFQQFYYALPGLALFPLLCLWMGCLDKSDLELLGSGLLRRATRSRVKPETA